MGPAGRPTESPEHGTQRDSWGSFFGRSSHNKSLARGHRLPLVLGTPHGTLSMNPSPGHAYGQERNKRGCPAERLRY